MPRLQRHPPRALFHAAVVVGCIALGTGIGGIGWFGLIPSDPRVTAEVLLRGLADFEGVCVEARWRGPEGTERCEVGRCDPAGGMWRFVAAPRGRPLTLVVRREIDGVSHPLRRQPAVLSDAGALEVWVPPSR